MAFLDVVRGVAAAAVLLEHLSSGGFAAYRLQVGRWLNLGIVGITVFFLVSGFIIPASLEKYGSLRSFWLGRLFRLYPMYLLTLVVVLILSQTGAIVNPLAGCRHLLACVAGNTTMLQEFVGLPSLISVAWTLGLELVFYLLCSLAFAWGWLRFPVRLAMAAVGVNAMVAISGLLLHRPVPAGRMGMLATCFFGMVVYRVYRGETPRRALWLVGPLSISFILGFWDRFQLYPDLNAAGRPVFTLGGVCISWALGYALFFGLLRLRGRELPASLQWLGKVSYSFYLLADFVPSLLPGVRSPWLWIAESFAVCTLLSAGTYRWIERPAMLAGARWRGRRHSGARAPLSPA